MHEHYVCMYLQEHFSEEYLGSPVLGRIWELAICFVNHTAGKGGNGDNQDWGNSTVWQPDHYLSVTIRERAPSLLSSNQAFL